MRAPWLVFAALWPSAFAAGQDRPAALAVALFADDAATAERARRKLCVMPRTDVPVEPVVRLLRHADIAVAARAASVLAQHGLAPDQRRRLLERAEPVLQRAAFDLASDDELMVRVLSGAAAVAIPALHALEDRGVLDVPRLVVALHLEAEPVAAAAVALLVRERAPFPVDLLPELQRTARQRLLAGLAARPRRTTADWVSRQLEREERGTRAALHAIAALPPARIDLEMGREVLRGALDPELAPHAVTASVRFPPALADKLVGYGHALTQRGAPLDTILQCLENMSVRGERQILALSGVLAPATVEQICSWLRSRRATGLDERIASALDGDVPLEPHLLRRAGKLLDRPERVERLLGLLAGADENLARLAFYALVDAGLYRPAMLAFALAADDDQTTGQWANRRQRVRALLQVPLHAFPSDILLGLLDDDNPQVRLEAYRALARSAYPESIETELVRRAAGDGEDRGAAGRAVASFGSLAALRRLWRDARSAGQRLAVVGWQVERSKPWTGGLLRDYLLDVEAALQDGGAPVTGTPAELIALRNELLRGLAVLGDAGAADRLLGMVSELPLKLLRRCADFAPTALRAEHIALWRAHLIGQAAVGPDRRELLCAWLSARPDLPVHTILAKVHAEDLAEEVRIAALAGLLRGEGAGPFHERLRAAMSAPLGIDERDLAFEILGSARLPVRPLVIETMARLLLVAPLADPAAEVVGDVEAFPVGGDYSFHLPFTDLVRRDEEVDGAPFAAVAAGLVAHPAHDALSRRRLGHLLCQLARFPHTRAALGPALAAALLRAPDRDARFDGVARLMLAEAAEHAGRFDEAAEHYRAATRLLLRDPLPPLVARGILGEANPVEHLLPDAALAARSWICRARALAPHDPEAARRAAANARELAEGDGPTERETETLIEELQ